MRLVRLVAPGLIGLALVAGFRMGMDWTVEQIDGPKPAAAVPYAPGNSPAPQASAERRPAPGLLAGL